MFYIMHFIYYIFPTQYFKITNSSLYTLHLPFHNTHPTPNSTLLPMLCPLQYILYKTRYILYIRSTLHTLGFTLHSRGGIYVILSCFAEILCVMCIRVCGFSSFNGSY